MLGVSRGFFRHSPVAGIGAIALAIVFLVLMLQFAGKAMVGEADKKFEKILMLDFC